jgi:hypothetical protein
MNYIGTQVEHSEAPKGVAAGQDSQSMDITAAHSRAWWIVRASVLAAGLALVGCAGEVDQADLAGISPVLSAAAPRIFGGEAEAPDATEASGVVALRVGSGTSFELCTGALIASNVVVTARHCVTKNYGTKVSCDAQGRSTNGKHVAGDEDLSNIAIYTGSQPRFASKPAALARAIVAPSSYYLCDSDIAVVVLDRDVPGKPFSVRLHAPAKIGEHVRAVGYGQNDKKLPLGTRLHKTGVPVLQMGNGISASRTALGPHEFEVGQSICQGDSGGPAISEETGAVMGVVSRGGDCNDNFGHVFTTTAGFGTLFDEAFSIAGGTVDAEGGASERMPDADALALDGLGEAPKSETRPEPRAGSCSAAPGTTSGAGLGGLVLGLALTLGARARRRSR